MTDEDEEFNRIEREAAMRKEAVRATVAPREWVGLTDEEMAKLWDEERGWYVSMFKAVEAKLREKNT